MTSKTEACINCGRSEVPLLHGFCKDTILCHDYILNRRATPVKPTGWEGGQNKWL